MLGSIVIARSAGGAGGLISLALPRIAGLQQAYLIHAVSHLIQKYATKTVKLHQHFVRNVTNCKHIILFIIRNPFHVYQYLHNNVY